MATAIKTTAENPAAEPKGDKVSAPKPRTRRRWWLLLGLLVAGVAGLPTLIARTELRNVLLPWLQPGLPEGTRIDSAELGWTSPIVLRGIALPDHSRQPMLGIEELRIERTLWELLRDPSHIGTLLIRGPELTVVIRADGSNVQDVWNGLHVTTDGESTTAFGVRIESGRLIVREESGQELSRWENLQATYDRKPEESKHLVTLAATDAMGGKVEGRGEWIESRSEATLVGPGLVRLAVEKLPLDGLRPLLASALDGAAVAGDVTALLEAGWDELSMQGGEAELSLVVPSLQAAWQQPGQAPQTLSTKDARLQLRAKYDGTQDILTLHDSTFDSEWAKGSVRGTLSDLRGECLCEIGGDLSYPLTPWLATLSPEVRQNIRVEGLETRRFALAGPLLPGAATPDGSLRLETEVVWSNVAAYGVASQNARWTAAVGDGRVRINPIDVPVSGGRVVTVPELKFAGPALSLQSAGATLIENVVFTEELCRGWMRFLSPFMANVTTVDGRFSLALNAGEYSLADIGRSGLSGTLTIHDSQVGPGPLTQQVMGPIHQIRAIAERRPEIATKEREWLTIRGQQVPFVVRDGRVYHSQLAMQIGQVELASSGSVGLDDSLDLLLVVRLPDKWFENRPVLAAMRRDGLRLPVRGTLQRPQVDANALREFLRSAGTQGLDGLLKKLLDR